MKDVIIIGAGPVGIACAIEAKRRGRDATVIEKGAMVNSLVGYPTQMEFFSTPDLLEIGGHPFPTLGYKPAREEAIEYYRRVAQVEQIEVRLYERVTGLDGSEGAFTVKTEEGAYDARHVVIATGFFDLPNLMHVPGEDLPHVTHYFKEAYPYSGQRVAVVGSKNSSAKAALQCYRHGAEVTMIVRRPAISDKVKYWIKPDLENRVAEGAINALFNTSVTAIDPDHLVLETPDGPQTLPADWVLALTGYRPDYMLLGALGIEAGDDDYCTPVHDPETFETSRSGVYIAGTVCGGLNTSRWFIENGREHAKVVMEGIARKTVPSPLAGEG